MNDLYSAQMDSISLGHLAAWRHAPSGNPRARVLLIHGLGEHSARHINTIEYLVSHGVEVVRFDLRGAGLSGGLRQWVERFGDYVEDAAHVLHWIQRELPALPLFVLGHSLGGAVATYFTAIHQAEITGLVLSAPAHRPGLGVSPVKIAVGRWLCRVFPKLRIPGSLDNSSLSKDPTIGATYTADPLACHFNTLRQGNEILEALDAMVEQAKRIHVPVFIAHGSMDRLVRLDGSFELLTALASKDKSLYIVPNGYHELHNDLEKEEYFRTLLNWVEKHCPPYSRDSALSPANGRDDREARSPR